MEWTRNPGTALRDNLPLDHIGMGQIDSLCSHDIVLKPTLTGLSEFQNKPNTAVRLIILNADETISGGNKQQNKLTPVIHRNLTLKKRPKTEKLMTFFKAYPIFTAEFLQPSFVDSPFLLLLFPGRTWKLTGWQSIFSTPPTCTWCKCYHQGRSIATCIAHQSCLGGCFRKLFWKNMPEVVALGQTRTTLNVGDSRQFLL